MSNSIIIPELNNSKIRRTEDGRFSVFDIIRIAGGQKNPRDAWSRLCVSHREVVDKTDNLQFPGAGQRNTPVANTEGSLYILGLLPGECGQKYREFAANLVRRYIEGDADLGVELLYRDTNQERFERAKRRIRVTDTNKQTAAISIEHGVSPALLHNDRYRGLYGKTAKRLTEDCPHNLKGSTPLNAMSTRDLALNELANIMAIEANDPNIIFTASSHLKDSFEKTLGCRLSPKWELELLRPDKAARILNKGQMEIPV